MVAKIEGRNPAYSVKCRIGAAMIWDAEKRGILKPGSKERTIVEPTSGNTGIALAFVAAARGYPLVLTMPETMSLERRRMLKAFGAELVLTEGAKGMKGAIAKAEEIAASDPEPLLHAAAVQEPGEPRDPLPHHRPRDLGRHRRQGRRPRLRRRHRRHDHRREPLLRAREEEAAVERRRSSRPPRRCSPRSRSGETPKPGPHKIQGIGAGFKPDVLDLDLVDEVATVTNEEAIEFARRLHKEEGITVGISCGAAAAVATRVAARPESQGKLIVAILPDAGDRYHSSVLFQDIAV